MTLSSHASPETSSSTKKAVSEKHTYAITTTDHRKIVAYSQGPTAQETPRATLLLLHGYPDTHAVWDEVAYQLASEFRILRYDVRGAGASDRPAQTKAYALEQLADDLFSVLQVLSPSQAVHVVGHDWGSIQAWEALCDERAHGKIASFTSISGPCLDHVGAMSHQPSVPVRQRLQRALDQLPRSWYIAAFHIPLLAPTLWRHGLQRRFPKELARREQIDPHPAFPAPTLAEDGAFGVHLYRANMIRRLRNPCTRIPEMPVHMIVPLQDPFVAPFLSEGVEPFIPHLYRREVEGGHWIVRKKPSQVAEWITEFLSFLEHPNPDKHAFLANVQPPAGQGTILRGQAFQTPTSQAQSPQPQSPQPQSPQAKAHGSKWWQWSFLSRKTERLERTGSDTKLYARPVRMDWQNLPLWWVANDPHTTHVINVLHLLLPAGERWFCKVLRQTVPLIRDERLRAQVRGFMAQESSHASAHQVILDSFAAHQVDISPFIRNLEALFDQVLCDKPFGFSLSKRLQRTWLVSRVAFIAAVEHGTSMLGIWVLDADALEAACADPAMMLLLRWHGAEEVEHRAVVHDLAEHLGVRYPGRVAAGLIAFPVLVGLWVQGTAFLLRTDPGTHQGVSLRRFEQAAAVGKLPSIAMLLGWLGDYLRPDFHPSQHGSTERAVEVLAQVVPAIANL
jgi:predicted metal-dependent hydrolase/pimeloyl-ACP methyl ester carboxylesterase